MRLRTYGPRPALRLVLGLALVAALLALATPALADHCEGSGWVGDRGGQVEGECREEASGGSGGAAGSAVWDIHCAAEAGSYQGGDEVEFVRMEPLTEGDVEHLGLDPSGVYWWWNVVCLRGREAVFQREIMVEESSAVAPEVVRDRARARIDPPAPAPASSPPLSGTTYVNVATWLWLDEADWTPIEVSETQGLVTVTVRATPTQASWDMGDGEVIVCDGPGVIWETSLPESETDCSHTYAHSSYGEPEGRFDGSVTVTWRFEWWINGVYQGGFGLVDLVSGFEVAVGEIQAVETGG